MHIAKLMLYNEGLSSKETADGKADLNLQNEEYSRLFGGEA